MIKYNNISIDGDYLNLDFQIEDRPQYEGLSITGVRVDIPTTYGTDTPYYFYNEDDVTQYRTQLFIPDVKRELLIITPQLMGLDTIPADSPCGTDIVNITAVYDKSIVDSIGSKFLCELGSTCDLPAGFIDFILKQKALELSIATSNIKDAIKYWASLTNNNIITNCNCNG